MGGSDAVVPADCWAYRVKADAEEKTAMAVARAIKMER
jgi:hypothetical protein